MAALQLQPMAGKQMQQLQLQTATNKTFGKNLVSCGLPACPCIVDVWVRACVSVCVCACICCCLNSKCTQGLRSAWSGSECGSLIYFYSLLIFSFMCYSIFYLTRIPSISGIFQAKLSHQQNFLYKQSVWAVRESEREGESESNGKHLRRRTVSICICLCICVCVYVWACSRAASGGVSGVFFPTAVSKCPYTYIKCVSRSAYGLYICIYSTEW